MAPIDYNNQNKFWTQEERDFYKGLSDDERIAATILRIVYTCLGILVAVFLCALFSGCTTTKYVPVPEYHTDTLRVTQYQRDSVYVHDSTEIRINGDTVCIDRWHTAWRDRIVRDTIYQSKRDSIPYPVEVTKRCPGIGFLSRGHREIGVLRNVEPPTRPRLECLREIGRAHV